MLLHWHGFSCFQGNCNAPSKSFAYRHFATIRWHFLTIGAEAFRPARFRA